jgi:hypothetical protein
MWGTDAIVTPVAVEFSAGFTRAGDVKLAEQFLKNFTCLDKKSTTHADWDETMRQAKRIPPNGARRQLGDCLIRALAKRLHADVIAFDRSFPP